MKAAVTHAGTRCVCLSGSAVCCNQWHSIINAQCVAHAGHFATGTEHTQLLLQQCRGLPGANSNVGALIGRATLSLRTSMNQGQGWLPGMAHTVPAAPTHSPIITLHQCKLCLAAAGQILGVVGSKDVQLHNQFKAINGNGPWGATATEKTPPVQRGDKPGP